MEREGSETAEDIDRLLADAKKALQDFEDGADWRRLLLRVRTASPAHPVLLARFLFGGLTILALLSSVGVLVLTLVSEDIARTLALFESVIPWFPEEIPALPALLVFLGFLLGVGWALATYAAISLGRDTTMLPWEQKQHQKLVNEVTRLTTQKAVMERIRATPAGARPRIATPVPVAARSRAGMGGGAPRAPREPSAPPTPQLRAPAPPPEPETPTYAAPSGGGFGGGGGFGAPPGGGGGFGFGRGGSLPPTRLGAPAPRAPVAEEPPTGGDELIAAVEDTSEIPMPVPAPAPARPGGLLSRAKSAGFSAPAAPSAPPAPPAPEPYTNGTGIEVADDPDLGYSPPAESVRIPTAAARRAPTPPPESAVAAGAGAAGGMRLGGVRLGAARSAPEPAPVQAADNRTDDFSDLVEVTPPGADRKTPAPAPDRAPPASALGAAAVAAVAAAAADPDEEGGILSRARAGAAHLRSTPFGSAGRIRPPTTSTSSARPLRAEPTMPPPPPAAPPPAPQVAVVPTAAAPTAAPTAAATTRGGTPLGSAPRAGVSLRTGGGMSRPSAPSVAPRNEPDPMFGTPNAASARAPAPRPPARPAPPPEPEAEGDEVTVMEEEEDATPHTDRAPAAPAAVAAPPPPAPAPRAPASTAPTIQRPFPRFGPISEPWLSEALEKAEKLQRSFPMQAYLEFSQEPHLPFTLVIARATPAMAVRAMVAFVEFLAQVATPPRARIELVNIPHLDRSFHKNVEAALEPYFQGNVEVEPNPGRVDILFTEPDPQWGEWSTLPVLDGTP